MREEIVREKGIVRLPCGCTVTNFGPRGGCGLSTHEDAAAASRSATSANAAMVGQSGEVSSAQWEEMAATANAANAADDPGPLLEAASRVASTELGTQRRGYTTWYHRVEETGAYTPREELAMRAEWARMEARAQQQYAAALDALAALLS